MNLKTFRGVVANHTSTCNRCHSSLGSLPTCIERLTMKTSSSLKVPHARTASRRPSRLLVAVACGLSLGATLFATHSLSANSGAMAKTGTAFKADADMQAVLDELALLGGKPIESLSPDEARKQPSPTDAVMSLLKKKGKDTSPSALVPGVTSVDREIQGAMGNIPARIYTPDGAGPFPVCGLLSRRWVGACRQAGL